MRRKIIFISALIIFIAVFMFDFVSRSSAENNKTQSPHSVKNYSSSEKTSIREPFAKVNWRTVVNNSFFIPGSSAKFSSYGQPSVNSRGVVVFRARSTMTDRQSGIYMRESLQQPVQDVADLHHFVPYPNNLNTKFTEFPAIARISMNALNIATVGNHKPVYRYVISDEEETRVGTTGIYTMLNSNLLITGASKLGAVPGFEHFAVPGVEPAIPFDVFPGPPAITDDGTIVFKGNYTENGVGKTGIFFRPLLNTPGGGNEPVELIANSDTEIPNTPPSAVFPNIRGRGKFQALTFDSTAPPTVAGDQAVFVGLDNEDDPHFGGIYMAHIKQTPDLRQLAGIGEGLPGLDVPGLTRIGEGLSFDGRYLGFWGAWGEETKTVRLYCPIDGSAEIIAYCNGVDPNSIFDKEAGRWYQEKQVPVNQGIFVLDILADRGFLVANSTTDFNDFLFWVYSGKPPGTGPEEEELEEPPRWRYSAFLTVSDGLVAFKARTGLLNDKNVYVNPIDGIYLGDVPQLNGLQTVLETGMDGSFLDPMLQQDEMPIIGVGIEREGFRGRNLAVTATMANEEAGWGGIYLANVIAGQPNDFRVLPETPKNTLLKSAKR